MKLKPGFKTNQNGIAYFYWVWGKETLPKPCDWIEIHSNKNGELNGIKFYMELRS